jgi:cell wall-associated NlpC family hydrolase
MGGHERRSYPAPGGIARNRGNGSVARSRRLILGTAVGLVLASTTVGMSAAPAFAAPVTAPTTVPTTTVPTTTTIPATTTVPTTVPAPTIPPPPTDLANGIAQATKLQLEIAANAEKADVLDGKLQKARAAVKVANKKIRISEAKISANEARVAKLRSQLASRAATLYMGAGNGDPIGFDVSSVQDLGSIAQYGDAAASRDERILDDLKHTEAELNAQRSDLETQRAAAQDRQRKADDARREVLRVNAAMKKLLDTTTAGVKLLATKMEQEALASASLAEQAWLQRMAERQKAGKGKGAGAVPPGDIGAIIGDIPAPSIGALYAVAYAAAQLGKPYVYAGAGPDVFDCSGLTMMAWKQAGVSMQHGSQSQYMSFPHIPLDQLQPGDLVFFGDSGPTNHHVGMVIGPGIMIDAPHTGAFVEIVSYYRSDLVLLGARPLPATTPPTP